MILQHDGISFIFSRRPPSWMNKLYEHPVSKESSRKQDFNWRSQLLDPLYVANLTDAGGLQFSISYHVLHHCGALILCRPYFHPRRFLSSFSSRRTKNRPYGSGSSLIHRMQLVEMSMYELDPPFRYILLHFRFEIRTMNHSPRGETWILCTP